MCMHAGKWTNHLNIQSTENLSVCMDISYGRFLEWRRMQPNSWSSLWIIDHRGEIWRKMHIFHYNSGVRGKTGAAGQWPHATREAGMRGQTVQDHPIHKNRHDLQHSTVVRSCCFDMIPLDSGVGSKCYISSKMCPLRIQYSPRGVVRNINQRQIALKTETYGLKSNHN